MYGVTRMMNSIVCVALPSQPLNVITLSDADNPSALSFVRQKLQESEVNVKFNKEQIAYIQRLGGRASDLESVRSLPNASRSLQY